MLYYLCSESKDADQLRCYGAADLCLCFCICKKQVFLYGHPEMTIAVYWAVKRQQNNTNHYVDQSQESLLMTWGFHWYFTE